MADPRAQAQSIAQQIRIPPRPEVLITFREEMSGGEPDFKRLVTAVSSDVSMSGAVLQVINSPAYGMRNKITSINQACSLLGLVRVEKVVQSVALRSALSKGLSLERFWENATDIANLSRLLAIKLSGIHPDDAYTLGLFHDCGVPLLLQHFSDYKQTLTDTNRAQVIPATKLENERYGINHADVGYEVAVEWFLPDSIARAIQLHHHDLAWIDEHDLATNQVYSLIIILKIAEFLSASMKRDWRNDDVQEWHLIGAHILNLMAIDKDEFADICDEVIDAFRDEA